MKIDYYLYELTPLKQSNAKSSLALQKGIYFRSLFKGKELYADYFPHAELGDRSSEELLEIFKYQDHEYEQKVFHFLLRDQDLRERPAKSFFNHALLSQTPSKASTLKYKLQVPSDISFVSLWQRPQRLRLDANGIFQRQEWVSFLEKLPPELIEYIDYVEDPLPETDWSDLPLPRARDFIAGAPFETLIHKPNARFMPQGLLVPIIFSSYMGGSLGTWHAYCELRDRGDLSLTHGILTSGYYKEEWALFSGDFMTGFLPQESEVKKLYRHLAQLPWRSLCSM